MIPRDTVYRLAAPHDLKKCHALMRAQGEDYPLTWLTVLAERQGRVLGFLSTQLTHAVVAGPLVIAPEAPRPGLIAWRLAEAYENALRIAGVRVYWFHVAQRSAAWAAILAKLDFVPAMTTDTGTWFQRRVA